MSITSLMSELNESQKAAASMPRQHALILAGAGCGKTKTIIARAAYLISNGTPPSRILILTFTRRSSSEIVERVRLSLGDAAEGLKASTFHTWCVSLIRNAPTAFGCKNYSVIDRDDQEQVFKLVRGKEKISPFPNGKQLCDIYSFARNTLQTLGSVLSDHYPEYDSKKDKITQIMLAYEEKKRDRQYLDYDDILDIVAQTLNYSNEVCSWVGSQYDYVLVDEMQDTNPLQWKLLKPLKSHVTLFCVGDDAQSIYGFRGADFRNVHNFTERVENSVLLKLEQNYRSTQEILDVSNWLLSESELHYGKQLVAMRGNSNKLPQLRTFSNEWEEGRWIAEDLVDRVTSGANWNQHMILVRSGFSGRKIEVALLAKEIPYQFIGGMKLLESAHIKDVFSALRVVANLRDEIGWMRFITLWQGIGDVKANRLIEQIFKEENIDNCITLLKGQSDASLAVAANVLHVVKQNQNNVSIAINEATRAMEAMLADKYGKKDKKDWDKRKNDFELVEKLAQKHTSILEFIEEYLLNPVYGGEAGKKVNDLNVVTIITVHSAKGTECDVCYVVNVSVGSYPSSYAIGDVEAVEEERRVLYVALTRAKDELIVTRQGYKTWAVTFKKTEQESSLFSEPISTSEDIEVENYFFNALPMGLFEEHIHQQERVAFVTKPPEMKQPIRVGILLETDPLVNFDGYSNLAGTLEEISEAPFNQNYGSSEMQFMTDNWETRVTDLNNCQVDISSLDSWEKSLSSSYRSSEIRLITDDWETIVSGLKAGFTKQFASRCVLEYLDETECRLNLEAGFESLLDESQILRLESALRSLFRKPLKLSIVVKT